MLVDAIHQVATLTADTDRLHALHRSVFGPEATLDGEELTGARLSAAEVASTASVCGSPTSAPLEIRRRQIAAGAVSVTWLGPLSARFPS